MAKERGSMTEGFESELPRMIPSKNEWMSHAPAWKSGSVGEAADAPTSYGRNACDVWIE